MQFYYRGDDLAPFWHFLGLELLYNGIFIISLQVLSNMVWPGGREVWPDTQNVWAKHSACATNMITSILLLTTDKSWMPSGSQHGRKENLFLPYINVSWSAYSAGACFEQ